MIKVIDIGHDHSMRYFRWSPDRELNPQYDGIPDEPKAGIIIDHKKPDGTECSGVCHFDTPVMQKVFPEANHWQVESWDPLTMSPSILCRTCGDHGFIREGRWVPA